MFFIDSYQELCDFVSIISSTNEVDHILGL